MCGLSVFLALSLNLVILCPLGQFKNDAKLIKLFDKKIFFEMRCGQEIHLKCGDTPSACFGTFPKHPLNALSPVPIIRKVNMVGHSNMLVSQDGQSNMVV